MDWLANSIEGLAKQASELTMYDIKAAANKAKAMVLNLSEMETMVREATNDDAWGASSTLMQQIAQAQLFNEIMPTIYGRFTEKEARQWRQIYKSLVLLEYLVKNGSERVIDDARAHMSLIKVLRNFHYTDEAGKDQGINVRNRSKELAELLSDLDRVRQERRKAKANRNKYTGVSSEGSGFGGGSGGFSGGSGPSFQTATGSRYGGFGSDSLESGGGGGGGGRGGFTDTSARSAEYEEYDAGDWEDSDRRRGSATSSEAPRASSSRRAASSKAPPAPPKPEPPKQEVNLFDFDDDEPAPAPAAAPLSFGAPASAAVEDDFDDFQSAAPSPPAPATNSGHQNVFALLNAQPAASPPVQPQQPSYSNFAPLQAQPARPPMQQQSSSFAPLTPSSPARPAGQQQQQKPAAAPAAKPASDFSDLFSFGGMDAPKATPAGGAKLTMAELAAKTRQDQLFKANGGGANGGQMSGWDSLM